MLKILSALFRKSIADTPRHTLMATPAHPPGGLAALSCLND
jgi:hypothetical protein